MQSDLCLNDQPRSSSKKDNLESDGRHLTHVGSKTDQAIGYSVEPLSGDVPQEATDSSSNENKNVASLSLCWKYPMYLDKSRFDWLIRQNRSHNTQLE